MNMYLKTGSVLVVFALLNYSVFFVSLRRGKSVSFPCMVTLILGILFDGCATGFMIAGSGRGFITIHGIIGYSALGMMIADGLMIARKYLSLPRKTPLSRSLMIYSMVAYIWWCVVFLSGVASAMSRKV